MKHLALASLILLNFVSLAQKPTDYLSSEFHAERRAALRKKMPENSVAVVFSGPVRNRANDVNYVYHQDPNFYYLTGHREPHAVLLVFKDEQKVKGKKFDEIIFVREHNALMELYEGGRLGQEGAKEVLAIDAAFEGTQFGKFNLDFSKFDKVLFYDFENDVRDTNEEGDLYDLIAQFKEKIGYNQGELMVEAQPNNLDVALLDFFMTELREIKTEDELDLLRKAINISAIGQVEVMKAMQPGMSETEVQGMHEFIYKKYRAEYEGYPSIVGAGHNGCVLHYIDNYKPAIEDGELILMDLGAEYHGYTADVTRTIPVNGTFSPEQKLIYDIVYDAQQAAADSCKAGLPFYKLYDITAEIVNNRLVELGLYKSTSEKDIVNPETGRNRYYPHGCCHHIGLDVHDKGIYDLLQPNMVITIEPGIYIPEGSPTDPKWWNIPVRIEDDYLVTEDGCENLSIRAPRKAEEIEKTMAEPSVFTDYVLPDID
ncbi:Xaa-Pro aminopeptidase [Reichenbachiella sp. 5M10]|uniref:aminopeptidase P N-terminal domain-containing protein n=1 Tax=Reichenbachiella sp. 5M10 TaxID=1889772 RepID=UPI000C150F60|nr:aminopeptidase P N-terminal domain-containing protein [Reichenbachiella sp. 5M10]PIB37045.1 Xaa-Pro aminopeptidase [Reichenbachiella sp. 5M10]